jgi:hypothetical protein
MRTRRLVEPSGIVDRSFELSYTNSNPRSPHVYPSGKHAVLWKMVAQL